MPVVLGAERILAPTRGTGLTPGATAGPSPARPAGTAARPEVTAGPAPAREATPRPTTAADGTGRGDTAEYTARHAAEDTAEDEDDTRPPRRPAVVVAVVLLVLLLAVLAVWLLPRVFTVYGAPADGSACGQATVAACGVSTTGSDS
jgi:serine/threonine-protein kinase